MTTTIIAVQFIFFVVIWRLAYEFAFTELRPPKTFSRGVRFWTAAMTGFASLALILGALPLTMYVFGL